MRFCGACGRVMRVETGTGSVEYSCSCGRQEAGGPEAARVFGDVLTSTEVTEMYDRLVRSAPFDRTCQLVAKTCPDCGLDYMSQIRVGAAEVIIYRCKCGWQG